MKAKLTLAVSPTDDGLFVGHSWIIIKNVGDEDFIIGDYLLEVGKTLTMGKYMGLPIGLHNENGVYYNLECIEQNKYFRLRRNIGITKIIYDEEINKIQMYLLNNADLDSYDLALDNCCHFSTGLWNSTCDFKVRTDLAPAILFNQILITKLPKGYKKHRRIKLPKDMLHRRFKIDSNIVNEDILNDLCDNQDSSNHIIDISNEDK